MQSTWIATGLAGILGASLAAAGAAAPPAVVAPAPPAAPRAAAPPVVPQAASLPPATTPASAPALSVPAPVALPAAASEPAAPALSVAPAPASRPKAASTPKAKTVSTPSVPATAPAGSSTQPAEPKPQAAPAGSSTRAAKPTPQAATPPVALDATLIPAYKVLSPQLAVGGQPSKQALDQLAAWGFRTVVNLRTDAEGAQEERQPVEAQGLRYVQVPVTPATIGWDAARAVLDAIQTRGSAPVLLHCASANRVGAIWALAERLQGKPLEEALASGRNAGMTSEALVEKVRQIAATPPPARPKTPAPPAAASAPRP